MNNKILLALFLVLLAAFALSRFFSRDEERTYDPEIIKIDSAQVTSIIIRSKTDSLTEILLRRENEHWTVSKHNKTVPAARETVRELLSSLQVIKASHIAAKSSDKWEEYEVGDDKASHLSVYSGNKVLTDFYVGKFLVNQEARQITSFFRLNDREEVFAVEGMAGMVFGQGFDSYRDKRLLDLDLNSIDQLKFEGDQHFMAAEKEGEWLLDGSERIDSNKIQGFLINLLSMSGEAFANDFNPDAGQAKLLKKLTISGSNMPEPVVVRCWQDTTVSKPFIIQSSQFPESFFVSDSSRLFQRLFKPVSEW